MVLFDVPSMRIVLARFSSVIVYLYNIARLKLQVYGQGKICILIPW